MGYFRADRLADVHSRLRWRNLRNLRPSVFAIPGNTRARDWRTFQPDASFQPSKASQAELLAYIPQVLVTDFAPTPLSQYEKVLKKLNDSSWSLHSMTFPG